MDIRAGIAWALCHTLEEACVPFGIIHGAGDFPNTVGRDFDILMPANAIKMAVGLVCLRAEELGWKFLVAPIFWAGVPVVFWQFHQDGILTFEMHFMPRLEWGGTILAELEPDDVYRDPTSGLPLARRAGFAKRVLTQILAGCWDRIAARTGEFVLSGEEVAEARRHADRRAARWRGMPVDRAGDAFPAFGKPRRGQGADCPWP